MQSAVRSGEFSSKSSAARAEARHFDTSGGTTSTGGLLGDVLADVANLLNGGSPLSSLGPQTNPVANSSTGLVGPEIDPLETGLTQILNQILSGLTSSTASSGAVAKAARAGSHGPARSAQGGATT